MRSDEIGRLLPLAFQRHAGAGGPLHGLLEAMAALHAPSEAAIDGIDAILDPMRTPDRFVPFLARWTDLERLFTEGGRPLPSHPLLTSHLGRLRELVAHAARLALLRGTSRGLCDFLRLATGLDGFAIDEDPCDGDGRRIHFHIRIRSPRLPPNLVPLVLRIVEQEKPAHLTWSLDMEAA